MSKVSDVPIDSFLQLQKEEGLVVVDVRSPKEYEEGHMVGVYSLPLFSNAERARVGTTYKQVDPRQALLEGLEIVGPKMRELVEQVDALTNDTRRIGVYCWRGGSRSGATAWLLSQAGYQVFRLIGGYKAYRRHGRQLIERMPFDLRVVDGPTGSGKTAFLHALSENHQQVLDLEAIANHKGSAFGLSPGAVQPSSEHAENLIHARLASFDESRPVWVENESKNIGKVYFPDGLVAALSNGHRIELKVPVEDRVEHIVQQYGAYPKQLLVDTFVHLRKRLGGKGLQDALMAIDAGDLHAAARVALLYYDKAYAHYTKRQGHPSSESYEVGLDGLIALATRLALGVQNGSMRV